MQIVNAVNFVHNCLCSLKPRSHSQLLSILWKCDIQLEESSSHCVLGKLNVSDLDGIYMKLALGFSTSKIELYSRAVISSQIYHSKDYFCIQLRNSITLYDIRITAIFHVMEDFFYISFYILYILDSKVKIFLMPKSLSCAIKTTLVEYVCWYWENGVLWTKIY